MKKIDRKKLAALAYKDLVVLVLGAVIAISALALRFLNSILPKGVQIPYCLCHDLLRLYCPLCGCTRAGVALLRLDFAESFHEMLDSGLIEEVCRSDADDPMYMVTDKGRIVATELHSEILSSLLDKSLECALRYLDFKKRNITVSARIEKREDGRYDVICILKEKNEVIMQNSVVVDTIIRAQRMEDNFRDHPEVVYKGVMALLSGNINFIFN